MSIASCCKRRFAFFCQTYQPIWILSHKGSDDESGHFTSFVNSDRKWYSCDDEKVRLVKEPPKSSVFYNAVVFAAIDEISLDIPKQIYFSVNSMLASTRIPTQSKSLTHLETESRSPAQRAWSKVVQISQKSFAAFARISESLSPMRSRQNSVSPLPIPPNGDVGATTRGPTILAPQVTLITEQDISSVCQNSRGSGRMYKNKSRKQNDQNSWRQVGSPLGNGRSTSGFSGPLAKRSSKPDNRYVYSRNQFQKLDRRQRHENQNYNSPFHFFPHSLTIDC